MFSQHLRERYPGDAPKSAAYRDFLDSICRQYIGLGLADREFESELCRGHDGRFWQRLSEALLANELVKAGHTLHPRRAGPDFLTMHGDRKVWIEVICPEPAGLPSEWLEFSGNGVTSFPHREILLRWTAAIKEKSEKLLGNALQGRRGYLANGLVAPGDAYVIAVNSRMLRGPGSAFTGISQFPMAVEAVFAVGPYQVRINRETLEVVETGHQDRPWIEKPRLDAEPALIPAFTFLDPAYRQISAIWATEIDGTAVIGNGQPMAVVHNVEPANAIPLGFLPALEAYVPVPEGDGYRITRVAD